MTRKEHDEIKEAAEDGWVESLTGLPIRLEAYLCEDGACEFFIYVLVYDDEDGYDIALDFVERLPCDIWETNCLDRPCYGAGDLLVEVNRAWLDGYIETDDQGGEGRYVGPNTIEMRRLQLMLPGLIQR